MLLMIICEILCSNASDAEDYSHSGGDVVQSGVNLLAFRNNLPPPFFSLCRWSQTCTRLHDAAPNKTFYMIRLTQLFGTF